MLAYYESWKGRDLTMIDRISINDEMITNHLRGSILQDHTSQLLSVEIRNFPNETGYFMLWELSISEETQGKRILPIFVNDDFVLRPMAGGRIMDVFLDGNSQLVCHMAPNIPESDYQRLQEISMDFAYNTFVELKERQEKRSKEQYEKYKYALSLRRDAAEHIGIDNIRRSRIAKEPLNNRLYLVSTQCISRHLRLAEVISAQNSHYLSTFLLRFPKKGRLPLCQVVESFRPAMASAYKLAQANIAYSRFSFFFRPRYTVFL